MLDLHNLAPYMFSGAFLWVVLILVALLLAPTWEHLKWERGQRNRDRARARREDERWAARYRRGR
jgi:hypothetical protein